MKVFGLINRNSGPGFHRIQVPLLLMPDCDAYITNAIEESDFEERRPDVVYYNRMISDSIINLRSKYRFKVVVDVDDYWHLDPHHIAHRHYRDNEVAKIQERHLQEADLVTCTHDRLATEVAKFNKNVVILPNAIPDYEPYFPTVRTQSGNGHLRVFWQGSVTHEKDLELLRKTIRTLEKDKFMMVLAGYTEQVEWERMVSCYTNYMKMPGTVLPGLPPNEYYSNYQYADVCVVPLLSTKFNGYKSNLKILEAAHLGLPVIASDVYPYRELPGVLYVSRSEDWGRWLRDTDAQKEGAEVLAEYCNKKYNFTEINQLRRACML